MLIPMITVLELRMGRRMRLSIITMLMILRFDGVELRYWGSESTQELCVSRCDGMMLLSIRYAWSKYILGYSALVYFLPSLHIRLLLTIA